MTDISLSDKAVLFGIIAIGVYFGVYWMYDVFHVTVNEDNFAVIILQYILGIGIILLVIGILVKIVNWKRSSS